MKATIELSEPTYRTIRIELPWPLVEQELDRTYRELAKEVNIKGFRKGKVPRSVLRQRYGRKVEEDVVGHLIQDSYEAAIVQHQLRPVAKPDLNPGELKEGQSYVFTARVEVRPPVDLKQYQGLNVERPTPQVKPEMVEEALKRIREDHATLVPVEGRDEARLEDTAIIDYLASIGGKPIKGGEKKSYPLVLGAGKAIPGIEEQVVGMKVGQRKDFDVTYPKDAPDQKLAGKQVRFQVTLNAIKQREVPPLNDEFVVDLGIDNCSTVAMLRERTEKMILAEEEVRIKREAEERLIDGLIAANPLVVPPSLVDRQQELFVAEMEMLLMQQGADLQRAGLSRNHVKQEMKDRAERAIRADLLLSAIAEREKIVVSEDELNSHLEQMAQRSGQNVAQMKARYSEPRMMGEMRYRLLRQKALDYLLDSSNIQKDSTPAPTTEQANPSPGDNQ